MRVLSIPISEADNKYPEIHVPDRDYLLDTKASVRKVHVYLSIGRSLHFRVQLSQVLILQDTQLQQLKFFVLNLAVPIAPPARLYSASKT